MAERTYYQDAYQRSFDALIVRHQKVDGHPAVFLDRTAFYPTGGGQPHDTGTLNGIPVVDVRTADDGDVVHLLEGELEEGPAHGEVNWPRRFDYMQQHTGQHILSQAFVRMLDAETVGFHLGEESCTIDLDCAPLEANQIAQAVHLANQIVLENRPVVARFVDKTELAAMSLRKRPVVEGPVRIVEVCEFDLSPCGGTHVRNSGEVGPIQAVRAERRKDQTRLQFLCGWRALNDYAQKQAIVQSLAALFTTAEQEIVSSVRRMESENKDLRKTIAAAQMQLIEHQLEGWIARAEPIGRVHVVRLTLPGYELALVKEAARRLVAHPGVVALLGTGQPDAQLVFARAEDVDVDMSSLIRTACAAAGGRGGGRPPFAQGSIPDASLLDRALDAAVQQVWAMQN